ncbi:hypothetical protein D3C81_526210 [compost metagenome]
MLRAQALVFLPVDEPLRLACWPALFVEAQFADHALYQALLVIAVEDLEVLVQPGFLPVCSQQTMGQAVEGAYPHTGRIDAHQLLDTLAHLGGSLVGEGHRQDRVWRGLLDLDQPGDAVHQHSGLTRAGTGQDQLTTDGGRYGLALGVVEGVQQEREIIAHSTILGARATLGQIYSRKTWQQRPTGHRPLAQGLRA